MVAENLLHGGEPQPGPPRLAGDESLENRVELVLGQVDTGSVVSHNDLHLGVLTLHRQLEARIHGAPTGLLPQQRLLRIAQQVHERLPKLVFLTHHGGGVGEVGHDLDAGELELVAHEVHEIAEHRDEIEPRQLGLGPPGEAQIVLGDRGEALDLTCDLGQQLARLGRLLTQLVLEHLGVEGHARQRVADLVGDLCRELARRRQSLAPEQSSLAFLERSRHVVELAREMTDLVFACADRGIDPLRPVAAPEVSHAVGESQQRPQRDDDPECRQHAGNGDAERQPEGEPLREVLGVLVRLAQLPDCAGRLRRELLHQSLDLALRTHVSEHVRRVDEPIEARQAFELVEQRLDFLELADLLFAAELFRLGERVVDRRSGLGDLAVALLEADREGGEERIVGSHLRPIRVAKVVGAHLFPDAHRLDLRLREVLVELNVDLGQSVEPRLKRPQLPQGDDGRTRRGGNHEQHQRRDPRREAMAQSSPCTCLAVGLFGRPLADRVPELVSKLIVDLVVDRGVVTWASHGRKSSSVRTPGYGSFATTDPHLRQKPFVSRGGAWQRGGRHAMVSPIRRPLASLLSFALVASAMATAAPAHAWARGQSVSLGSVEATSTLLVAQELAPASVLGLDGEDDKAAQELTTALRGAFAQRGLSGGEELSLVEMRLTMGCDNLEPSCMAEGGKTLGVDRLVYGNLQPQGPGKYQLELEILDVQAGVIEAQTSEPITADEMSAGNIDAKALAIVNGLLGSEEDPEPVPSAGTTLPDEPDDDEGDDTLPPDEPREKKFWFGRDENSPRWKKAGLGVGIALAALGLGGALGLGIPVLRSTNGQGALSDDIRSEAEASLDTVAPVDPDQGTRQICDQALNEPDPVNQPGDVYNADVGRPCRRGQNMELGANISWGVFGLGMALTITFTTLLLVHKKEPSATALRRRNFRLGVSPNRGGVSVGSHFRF